MKRQRSGSLLAGLAAVGYLATAALHSTGYDNVTRIAGQVPAEVRPLLPALWLVFSLDMAVVGLIVAVVACWPGRGSRLILAIAALCPIGGACLQLVFIGFVPPTAILLGVGALTIVSALTLPPAAPSAGLEAN